MQARLATTFLGVLLFLCAQGQTGKVPARRLDPASYVPGSVWVKLKPEYKGIFESKSANARMPAAIRSAQPRPFVSQAERQKSQGRLGPRKLNVDISLYYQLAFDKSRSMDDYIEELYATGYFETVEPEFTVSSLMTPNDASIGSQYYLQVIRAYEAWDVTQGDASIVIGIVDSGGDLDHPDLQSQLYIDPAEPLDGLDNNGDGYIDNNRGWDFSGAKASLVGTPGFIGDNDPSVPKGNLFGHGTMVAGCAAAATNNGIGIAGVGFKSKLLFTKHYSDDQPDNASSYSSNTYFGVLYVATHGAKIINCSWGGSNASSIAQDLINHVTLDLGCLVVAAAGNSNVESPLYPAAYDNVLSVAASDENDVRSSFSNYGGTVDLSAPGSNIYTTTFDNSYGQDGGTSFSAPIVSGAAALLWTVDPSLTPLQVAEQLRISSDATLYDKNPGYINKLGKGRLDIANALTFQSPSIRASKQLLVKDDGTPPDRGDDANLYFDFTNYLKASSSGLTVTLSSSSTFITITQNVVNLGTIAENGKVRNTNTPLKLSLSPTVPIDQPIEILLTFKDGAYEDFQLLNFVVPSFIDINENNITTTLSSAGRIGFSNPESQTNGSGFIYNDRSLLYEMGVIMGTSSSVLFNNVRALSGQYDQDFTSATKIMKSTPGTRSYSEVSGAFQNAPDAASASLLVSYRSLVWKNVPYQNFIILEYKIKNTAATAFNGFYMGLYADWDVENSGAGDRASWDAATRLGYIYPALPTTSPTVGIQMLSSKPQYYAIDNDQTIAGNPFGVYDGYTDSEKFLSISSGLTKIQAGDPTTGNDVSHAVASGPYTIAAGQEITIAFALHAASNTVDAITSAKYADSVYNYTLKAPMPAVADVEVCFGSSALLHATGATKFNWYKDFTGGAPIHTGTDLSTPAMFNDTVLYVSNAEKSYESLRTAAHIFVKSNPTITTSRSPVLCDGESVILSVNEADEYTWNTGEKTQSIEVSTAGTYNVVVRDNALNCTSPDALTVTVKPVPSAAFTMSVDLTPGTPVQFTPDDTPDAEWFWEFGDGTESNDKSPTHVYDALGTYVVSLTVTASNYCQSRSTQHIDIVTNAEPGIGNQLTAHPNPVNTALVAINYPGRENAVLSLFNAQGQHVLDEYAEGKLNDYPLNLSQLANGVYTLIVTTATGASRTLKIVILR
ncbi:S8 family serine peptidase [Chryseolinea soli]|uniref:T9SS C-terminal target domain-containing protein n=1 Tax=Chryseolinea soli TaxID=2321403 RepID=A0A385SI46_9BACT|nr:S8 family serine peptidase [Chryseolinea soli]AYB30889.1 T9SS C-terminal target domain-containing protein [Chryseolinea soli]